MWAPDEQGPGVWLCNKENNVLNPDTALLAEDPALPQTSWHVLGIKWVPRTI